MDDIVDDFVRRLGREGINLSIEYSVVDRFVSACLSEDASGHQHDAKGLFTGKGGLKEKSGKTSKGKDAAARYYDDVLFNMGGEIPPHATVKTAKTPSQWQDVKEHASQLTIAYGYAIEDGNSDAAEWLLGKAKEMGVSVEGEIGKNIGFNGIYHDTDDEIYPGDKARIISPGLMLKMPEGLLQLAKAKVSL